jgi:probable F420-dependent oxidoreductase
MRFSTNIPRYFRVDDPQPLRGTYEYARMLEEQGFYCGYVGHHSFTPETGDPSAPFAFLSAVAAQTERLRLGSGIYLGALHHPVSVCEQVSTLDQVSGGRAVLGLAVGYRDYEYVGFGVPYRERGSRLDETIKILSQAWATGRYGYRGKHFTIPDLPVYPVAVQKPRPPILIGGTSPAAIRRAATLGDGWISLPMETMDVVKGLAQQYRQECAAAGRKPYIVLMREAWVAPTTELVERDWLEGALAFHKYYWENGTQGDENDPILQRVAQGERVSYETFARDRAIAGTPDFCLSELARWQDEIGMDEIMLVAMTGQHGPKSKVPLLDMMRMFGTDVISEYNDHIDRI